MGAKEHGPRSIWPEARHAQPSWNTFMAYFPGSAGAMNTGMISHKHLSMLYHNMSSFRSSHQCLGEKMGESVS